MFRLPFQNSYRIGGPRDVLPSLLELEFAGSCLRNIVTRLRKHSICFKHVAEFLEQCIYLSNPIFSYWQNHRARLRIRRMVQDDLELGADVPFVTLGTVCFTVSSDSLCPLHASGKLPNPRRNPPKSMLPWESIVVKHWADGQTRLGVHSARRSLALGPVQAAPFP